MTLSSPETLRVDVEAFQSAVTSARQARTPDAYRSALALYPGDLLPEDRYEDWAARRRDELRADFLALLLEQGRVHEERCDWGEAAELFHRVLLSEPANEEAHVRVMRLHARAGQRNLALRQYEQLREALARELDAGPDPASRQVYAAILAGRFPPSHAVPPSTVAGMPSLDDAPGALRRARDEAGPAKRSPSNLPIQLSSFIGRQREIAETRRLLATARLLTLTGAGGCGKSRLAIEVASGVEPQFPDGIWLVELASLEDPSLLSVSVQKALGIPDQSGSSVDSVLADHLRGKRALLLLDNCEHLVGACARLVLTLLRACPKLSVLATSREPLRIAGETMYHVPSLSLPRLPALAPGEDLLQYDAIRLFVERARAVAPTFALTPQNRHPTVEVCRRLDGMPLALELAAARVRLLSIEQIADRLGDCFRLLTGGDRSGLARHQTLRATLDWSHQLLSGPERILFRRLAVFAGGFSLAGAEAVGEGVGSWVPGAGGGDVPSPSTNTPLVLDLLGDLVDKSFVVVEEQGNEPRYRLLETVRQYAQQRLTESGEVASVHEWHRTWCLALAERAEPALWGPQQKMWLDRLQAEHENLRLALAWSLENDAEGALRMAGHLGRFWADRGYVTEGRHWLARALAAPSAAGPRGRALLQFCILSLHQGDLATASSALRDSVPILRERGERWHLGQALIIRGNLAWAEGDAEGARGLYEASLAVQTEADDKQGAAMALAHLGKHSVLLGNHRLARALLEKSLGLFRETGDLRGIGFSLYNLGVLARHEGDFRRAKELLEESLVVARDNGHGSGIAGAINQLGRLALREGNYARAVRLMAAVTTSELPQEWHPADSAARDASLAEARAVLGEGAFASAWAEGEALPLEQAIDCALAMEVAPDE